MLTHLKWYRHFFYSRLNTLVSPERDELKISSYKTIRIDRIFKEALLETDTC